jgi:hypothetical protein
VGAVLGHLAELIPRRGPAEFEHGELVERPQDSGPPRFVEADVDEEAGAGVINAVEAVRQRFRVGIQRFAA